MNTAGRSWTGPTTGPTAWGGKTTEDRHRAGAERAKASRWAAPGRARVIHRSHGETIVPCASKFGAILCAADVWGCDWSEVLDAEVWRYEE